MASCLALCGVFLCVFTGASEAFRLDVSVRARVFPSRFRGKAVTVLAHRLACAGRESAALDGPIGHVLLVSRLLHMRRPEAPRIVAVMHEVNFDDSTVVHHERDPVREACSELPRWQDSVPAFIQRALPFPAGPEIQAVLG